MGVGYPDTPGIWTEEQVKGWRRITEAVHQAGGRMVLQLWHVGRISDPYYLNGGLPVAPSAIAAEGHVSLARGEADAVALVVRFKSSNSLNQPQSETFYSSGSEGYIDYLALEIAAWLPSGCL